MRNILVVVLIAAVVLISPWSAGAQDVPPSEESVRELMRLMDWRKTRDILTQVLVSSMQSSMRQRFGSEKLNDKQEQSLSELSVRYTAILNDVLSTDKTEPVYLGIYRSALTQSEVDAMIAFFRTDLGMSVAGKLPVVAKETNEAMTQRLRPVIPKLQEVQQEIIRRLQAEK